MKILITNDDGLNFVGLTALREVLSKEHEVYVSAPATEKSGTSSALTIFDNIFVDIIDDFTIMVEGFPVDCINIGLHGDIFPVNFDLVVSGINKGVNMGEDIIYSGTVGAARHALVHDIPAIAISTGFLAGKNNFSYVADFFLDFISGTEFQKLTKPFLLNINYPRVRKPFKKNQPPIKWTKMGRRIYRDKYKRSDVAGGIFFNLGGSELDFYPDENTDFGEYEKKHISITPLQLDATNYEQLEQFR